GIGEPPFLRAGSESVEAAAAAGGTARWTAALTLPATPPGTADLVVRARFVGADGGTLDDAFDVDDTGRARWIVGDPDRVLVVGPSGEAATRAARALGGRAFEGLDVRSAGIEELRTELARGPEPHVLVTIDVAHAELPADWLVPFVVERGGGWLHAAGYARLRSDGGRLAALDALEPDREPRTPRDVHFLIDSSGSMRGARWTRARAAIARLMPALGPKDRLSVRMFSLALGAPRVVFEPDPGEPAAERRVRFESALDSLRGIEPSGGSTDIAGSLATFLDHGGAGGGFARPPARGSRERVVVLLTDGYETVGLGDTVALRAKLEREDVRLVVLQVDESDDARRYLTRFLPPGESVRAVGELLGVYAILQAAVEGTEPLRGARLARSPAPVGAGRLGDVLRAVRDAVGPAGPLLDETVPARPTAGAGPVLDAVLDAVVEAPEDRTPEGRSTRPDDGGGARTVALAAAERGLGLSVGLAHPLVREGGTRGPTDLLARMGWAAPLLRAMAARRRAAGVDEVLRPASASIEGARIVVRDLPIELRGRAALEAELLEPGTIDAFGLVGEPVPVARVLFEPPVFAADAAGVRVARRPAGLDSVARGGRLLLRFADASLEASLELVADGPREVAALFDTRLDRASARRFPRREPPAEVGAMDDERERPAHATALLLAGAALVCAGAAGVALGNGRRAGTPSGSP
ncbi:MAG: vWA domain-containing protein, partial [Planctomycetota bacterium]